MNYYNNDYLMHYGVKGMKWGVRRKSNDYQTLGNRFHSRAARASQKDADDLRKHGYIAEADAVQKVADKAKAKAAASQKKYDDKQKEFGMKDVGAARKAVKESIKSGNRSNYDKTVKEQSKRLNEIGYADNKKANEAWFEARKAVKESMLLDAGYTKEKAKKGAEWLDKHGYNLTWTDDHGLLRNIEDQYD